MMVALDRCTQLVVAANNPSDGCCRIDGSVTQQQELPAQSSVKSRTRTTGPVDPLKIKVESLGIFGSMQVEQDYSRIDAVSGQQQE